MSGRRVTKEMIAKRLRLARENAGLSQGQVARLLDLHRPSISEAEAGRRNITGEELARLSRLYGVTASWLTCEEADVGTGLHSARIALAARELRKLKPADLDILLGILATMRAPERAE